MDWYLKALKNYAVFSGRAHRTEYWMFVLITVIITLILNYIDSFTGMYSADQGLGLLSGVYSLAVLVPSLAVGVRRLHDTDRSGWWIVLCLIPVFGVIALIVLLAMKGTAGDNQYGPDPQASGAV